VTRSQCGKFEDEMQTIVAYVENKPGVLNRVASLTRRLAINIDSLTVGPTENPEVARMTICAHTDEQGARRLEASLEKLVDVLLAENISDRSMLERDLALIKVAADHGNRPNLMELVKAFRGRIVDVSPDSVIVEVSDTTEKIDGLLEVLRPFGVLEMGRTGRIAMTKGNDVLRPPAQSPNGSKDKEIAPTPTKH
jgi:acetolactate synthase-1/3 small subunit